MNYRLKFGKPVKSILQLQDAFFVCVLICSLFLSKGLSAQDSAGSDFSFKRLELESAVLKDTIKKKDTLDAVFRMTRSPLKAVLYSAVVPGLGQVYNKAYWKIPVIWAFGGYFIYEIARNNNKYIDYRDAYVNSQSPENLNGDTRLKTLRDFYRDQRDQFYLYAALVYLINIFDAYVDAHLFDFDVSDNSRTGLLGGTRKLLNFKINF